MYIKRKIFLTILSRNSVRALTFHAMKLTRPTINPTCIFIKNLSLHSKFGFKKYNFNAGWIDLIHFPMLCGNHSVDMEFHRVHYDHTIQTCSPNRIKLTLSSTKKTEKNPI